MSKKTRFLHRSAGWPRGLLLGLLGAGVLAGAAGDAAAQRAGRSEVPEAQITGQVLDAESYLGLAGATVRLEVQRAGSQGSDGNGEPVFRPLRSTVTDVEGMYRFEGLRPARYRLQVERIGYFESAVEIDLLSTQPTRLSVGLSVAPVTLEPLRVVGRTVDPFVRADFPDADVAGARARLARVRQAEYLVSDTRAMSHAEVVEAVTLGETDLFRALQRAPGVTTRDDYTATMWTRGASWDQTRIFLDGLPLYNPTHAGWLFSAINPDAVGAAAFHPGYRPARLSEGAAGALDLRTRSGGQLGRVRSTGEISLASARFAVDGEALDGRLAWMVAARRTYVDLLSALARGLAGNDELYVPYDFADVVGRVDGELGEGWKFEASGIVEYDHLRGEIPGLLEGNRGRWGNQAGRVTLQVPLGPVHARVTSGVTHFSTVVREEEELLTRPVTLAGLRNAIEHRSLDLELSPSASAEGGGAWSAGIQLTSDSVSYDGPFTLLVALPTNARRDTVDVNPFTYGNALEQTAVWGERSWSLGSALTLQTGARVEFGDSVYNGGEVRVGPRFAARYRLGDETIVSAGWLRSFQYTQDVAPVAGPVGPQLHLSAIWVLASPARIYPAIRADMLTLGLEHWWNEGLLLGATVYRRDATGLKIPNPTPGAVTPSRDPDAEAANEAEGIELSARKLQGRWTGSLGYSLGVSNMRTVPRIPEAEPREFPSASDVRHAFDATAMGAVGRGLRAAAAFTYGSGVPFTRLLLPDTVSGSRRAELEAPNQERTRSYSSLDLMLEYSAAFEEWQMNVYLQVRNVLNRDNAVTYAGSERCAASPGGTGGCDGAAGPRDRFQAGLPRLPLFGVRISF